MAAGRKGLWYLFLRHQGWISRWLKELCRAARVSCMGWEMLFIRDESFAIIPHHLHSIKRTPQHAAGLLHQLVQPLPVSRCHAAAPEDHSMKDGWCHHRVKEDLQECCPALQRTSVSSAERVCSVPFYRVCGQPSPVCCSGEHPGTYKILESQCPVPGCSLVPEQCVYHSGSPPLGLTAVDVEAVPLAPFQKVLVQLIHPLLVPHRLLVGPLEPRHRLEALPDPTDVILLQLVLHFRPGDIFPLPDLHPQLPLNSPQFLLVTHPKDPLLLLEEGLYLRRDPGFAIWEDLYSPGGYGVLNTKLMSSVMQLGSQLAGRRLWDCSETRRKCDVVIFAIKHLWRDVSSLRQSALRCQWCLSGSC